MLNISYLNNIKKDMKIVNHNDHIKLVYNTKIVAKTKKYKTKAAEKQYKFYQGFLPFEIEEYLELKDKQIYFYEKDNKVYLTSREPIEENYIMRLQSANQYSLPRKLFPEIKGDKIILTIDFNKVDPYTKRAGLISLRLE